MKLTPEQKAELKARRKAVKLLDKAIGLVAEAMELTEKYEHDGQATLCAADALEAARNDEENGIECIQDEATYE